MSFAIGLKAIKRLCLEQKPLEWQRAKLNEDLFTAYEKPVFEFIQEHLRNHHVLPQVQTLETHFPDVCQQVEVIEPSSFYLQHLETRYYHKLIDSTALTARDILKKDPANHEIALKEFQKTIQTIQKQKYRSRLLDVGQEAPKMVMQEYFNYSEAMAAFGWPYMDDQSGKPMPGDIVSIVGRPAAGKTYLSLWTSLHNWRLGQNILFVSMEITILPLAQRIAAMYSGTMISQLKSKGFSSPSWDKFKDSMVLMGKEEAKFYVIDGNLAANMDEIFALADMLGCRIVYIDGAYLVRHPNPKLDRFTRVAENVELMKRYVTDLQAVGFASWQFNRQATTKKKSKENTDEVGLEDIGYSDAIPQTSSIVLGLFQEDGVETLKSRKIRVMKGRNGEIGNFTINWDFGLMRFNQLEPSPDGQEEPKELQWV